MSDKNVKNSLVSKLTNKSIKEQLAETANELNAATDEMIADLQKSHPDAEKRDLLSSAGKKADTHALQDARLSGLNDAEYGALKMFNPNMTMVALLSQSREAKMYIGTFSCMVAQKRSAAFIDLTRVNDAVKKINPKASMKQKGHKTCDLLVTCLVKLQNKSQKVLSTRTIKEQAHHETFTQADYIVRLLDTHGLGKRFKEAGGTYAIEIDFNHPFIKALLASQGY